MTFDMAQALRGGAPIVLLAELDHPSGVGRFWSGVGTLEWNGFSWTGAGILGTVTPIRHSNDLSIQEIVFSLAGVDPDVLAKLDDDVRNRAATVWLACLSDRGNVIPDPFVIVDAEMDFQSNNVDEDGTNFLTITSRSGFYTLDRSMNDVWSAEDQRSRYPDDSGLDFISGLQNQTLIWAP